MPKKIFITILILLVLAGVAGWYFIIRVPSEEVTPGPTASNDNGLFPFGERPVGNSGTSTGPVVTEPTVINVEPASTAQINESTGLPRLRQISNMPTAGIVTYDVGSTTLIRYIERATGHIHETRSDQENDRKISSVTIPKVYETLWTSDGTRLLIRYLSDTDAIKTFYAKISTSSVPEKALEGSFLPENIRNITLFGNKIYYDKESSSGSNGIIANIDGTGKTSIFASSFGDWTSKWTSPTSITMYPRPSGTAAGAAYSMNSSNGAYTKIASDLDGLTALGNVDGTLAIISFVSGDKIKTSAFNSKSGSIEPLGISTLTDKCVWSKKEKSIVFCAVPTMIPSGVYPDDWYKGKISLSDRVWEIDAVSGETNELFNPIFEAGSSFDIIDLGLNQSESVLVFRNKDNLTSWRYELEQ